MTSRRMMACWGAALAIVAVIIVSLSRPLPKPAAEIPDADIIFVGTSLTRAAIAQYEGNETAVAPGLTHFRLGMPSAGPAEILELFDEALAQEPSLIVLEINHFLFEFHHRRTDGWRGKALQSLSSVRSASLERARHMIGVELDYRQRLRMATEVFVYPAGSQDVSRAHRIYPLHIRQSLPSPELAERVERAKRQGIEVALLWAPRSATGTRFVGPETTRLLGETGRRVARELGVDLIHFGTGWDDRLYSDLGHLNILGQERFMRTLRDWFERQP